MVMKSNACLRQEARQRLGPRVFGEPWISLVLATVVTLILDGGLCTLFGDTEGTSFLVSVLISGVLSFGVVALMLSHLRGEEVHLSKLFAAFGKGFINLFLLGLIRTLYILLWALCFIVPGIIKAYAYTFAFHIAHDHPELEWKDCLKESSRITEGYKGQLFGLDFSFIGWYIVGLLCLGVGVLWVIPYHVSARTGFYEALLAKEELLENMRAAAARAKAEAEAKKAAEEAEKAAAEQAAAAEAEQNESTDGADENGSDESEGAAASEENGSAESEGAAATTSADENEGASDSGEGDGTLGEALK